MSSGILFQCLLFFAANTGAAHNTPPAEGHPGQYSTQRNKAEIETFAIKEMTALTKYFAFRDSLYDFRVIGDRLVVNRLSQGNREIVVDHPCDWGAFGVTSVVSTPIDDPDEALFVLTHSRNTSRSESRRILKYSLKSDKVDVVAEFKEVRAPYAFHFMSDKDLFAFLDPTLCRLISTNGDVFSIDIGHGIENYTSSAASNSSIALNIARGLTVYEIDKQPLRLWNYDYDVGAPSEVASLNDCWITTMVDSHNKGKAALLFCPTGSGYSRETILLRDGHFWRLTDYGESAVIWSSDATVFFVITKNSVIEINVSNQITEMKIIPGCSSTSLFFLGSSTYARLSISD